MPRKKKEDVVEEVTVEAKAPAKPKLVKMTRDGRKADVHPSEVKNFESHGWVKD